MAFNFLKTTVHLDNLQGHLHQELHSLFPFTLPQQDCLFKYLSIIYWAFIILNNWVLSRLNPGASTGTEHQELVCEVLQRYSLNRSPLTLLIQIGERDKEGIEEAHFFFTLDGVQTASIKSINTLIPEKSAWTRVFVRTTKSWQNTIWTYSPASQLFLLLSSFIISHSLEKGS